MGTSKKGAAKEVKPRKPKKAQAPAAAQEGTATQDTATAGPAPVAVVLPRYENAEVTEILSEGTTHHHCKMSDGTTKHVPVELFAPKPKVVNE